MEHIVAILKKADVSTESFRLEALRRLLYEKRDQYLKQDPCLLQCQKKLWTTWQNLNTTVYPAFFESILDIVSFQKVLPLAFRRERHEGTACFFCSNPGTDWLVAPSRIYSQTLPS